MAMNVIQDKAARFMGAGALPGIFGAAVGACAALGAGTVATGLAFPVGFAVGALAFLVAGAACAMDNFYDADNGFDNAINATSLFTWFVGPALVGQQLCSLAMNG